MPDKQSDKSLPDLVRRWSQSPQDFVVECLGAKPTKQQQQVLKALAYQDARIAISSGHGTGKSTVFSWVILWAVCCFYDVKVAVTAPTSHQLKDIVWGEVAKWTQKMLEPWKSSINIKADKIMLDGSPGFAVARTSRKETPEALQGFHAGTMIFLIDEASGIPEQIFEAARGSLSTKGARVVMASNPTRNSGYFYNAFFRNRDLWTRLYFSCLESPNVDPKFAKEIAEEYGENSDMYRVRVLGQFPLSSDMQFIPIDLAEKAIHKQLAKYEFDFAPKILGVDVAMFGGDRAVICLRQGLYSNILLQKRGCTPEELGGHVARLADEYQADCIVVDATGVGEALMSVLRIMHRPAFGFYGAERSLLANCANRRAEVWYKMRDWLRGGGSIPDIADLRDDLIGIEYQYNLSNKIQLERKADMRKRGLSSPDLADALALTFAVDIPAKNTYAACSKSDMADDSYDAYD